MERGGWILHNAGWAEEEGLVNTKGRVGARGGGGGVGGEVFSATEPLQVVLFLRQTRFAIFMTHYACGYCRVPGLLNGCL